MKVHARMTRIAFLALLLALAGCAGTPPRALPPAAPEPAAAPAPVPPPAAEPLPEAPEPEPAMQPQPDVRPRASAPQMQVLEAFAELNDEKLLYVYPGLSMPAVERIMGNRQSGSHVNPHKRQTIATVDGKQHEILFYLTRAPRPGRAITENELTPVIFVNNRVVAIGRYPLKKLRRSACQAGGVGQCP